MAKTAHAPAAPYFHEKPADGAGGRVQHNTARTASIEERTAVLETRWEQVMPTLTTRADLREVEIRLLKWGIGAGLALLAVFVSMFTASTARMDALDAKIDSLAARTDARFDALDAKIDLLAARTDARFDALDAKIDSRFDALMAELRAQRRGD